jgi:hypothetical protein
MSFLGKHRKNMLDNFVKFSIQHLEIKNKPIVIIQPIRNGLQTMASYAYGNGCTSVVRVYGKDRLLGDIMRSIAHELVHHKQFEDNLLEQKPEDIGGEIEDNANAIAGQIVKLFANINLDNKKIYEM